MYFFSPKYTYKSIITLIYVDIYYLHTYIHKYIYIYVKTNSFFQGCSWRVLIFRRLLGFKKWVDHVLITDRKLILRSFRTFALKLTQGWILWTATTLSHPRAKSRKWCWLPGCLVVAHGTSSGQRSGRWWVGEQVHPAPPPSAISCLEREMSHRSRSYSQGCFIKARSLLILHFKSFGFFFFLYIFIH